MWCGFKIHISPMWCHIRILLKQVLQLFISWKTFVLLCVYKKLLALLFAPANCSLCGEIRKWFWFVMLRISFWILFFFFKVTRTCQYQTRTGGLDNSKSRWAQQQTLENDYKTKYKNTKPPANPQINFFASLHMQDFIIILATLN